MKADCVAAGWVGVGICGVAVGVGMAGVGVFAGVVEASSERVTVTTGGVAVEVTLLADIFSHPSKNTQKINKTDHFLITSLYTSDFRF